MNSERLLLVGNPESIHIGAHLCEGGRELGLTVRCCDSRYASEAPRWLARLSWHLRGHRPVHLRNFSDMLVRACREFHPAWLLSTGIAPIDQRALAAIGDLGVMRLNYLTDDPWNPAHRAPWFLSALRRYDRVFSTRQSNLDVLRAHGCPAISYLPFAYSPSQHYGERAQPKEEAKLPSDVIFVGGADRDRLPLAAALIAAGLHVALYGGYWDRYPVTRKHHRGHADPQTIRKATAAAKIALCLVRRANRDGHVMRSFEIPAIGACMLVEDTEEHREIFGPDGEAVVYFRSTREMIDKARWLLDRPAERQRLAAAAHSRIVTGCHTYRDRLAAMLGLHTKDHEDRYRRPRPLSCV
jgi:glycosyltransferase involved in cell wall biosynthesis